jgi:ribose transport system ATP-binding protein
MLARGMSRDQHLYMFDEPTVGIDVQAKLEVYNFIKGLAESGNAVVIVSSEMAEVIHLSHRVCVMHEGRQVRELGGSGITEEAILGSIFHQHDASMPVEGAAA